VYHTYNTLFGVLQVLEHPINQITLQRRDILYCIIVVGNSVHSVLICRCKVRWHSDMEECGNKLSVGVEGEISHIIP